MHVDLILQNILNPPIMMFFLGIFAALVRSDLEIPQSLSKLFSLYLLIAIGLHGGYELSKSGISLYVVKVLALASFMAFLVPIYSFFVLRVRLDVYNAVAIAASYGSISAVTFITAVSFLDSLNLHHGGYMVAAMTLMESPAIVVGLLLLSLFARRADSEIKWGGVLKEALFNASVLLLVGTLLIGALTGEKGWKSIEPLFGGLFKGMLTFFLLDMGLIAGKRLGDVKKVGVFLIAFGVIMPIFNASLGILLAKLANFHTSDAFLFSILCASASYIAVPAAMRMSVPEANPSIYITLSLAITFPFNIAFGIPLYYSMVSLLWN
ncbi:MAG: sodium-dependent bicarbonate transport family permease [Aquificaceae bacterium]|nr:sodium-dependent bicarbonate transport family permease [Aquificaceae bacterium]MDW8236982.1 sodium-dependent bicarbonate transport family permease [Aquificaceae bacterium]